MKQQKARELLVTTRAAKKWKADFDQKVEELMGIVNRIDNDAEIYTASEMLDVYRNTRKNISKSKRHVPIDKPFQFLVFRN